MTTPVCVQYRWSLNSKHRFPNSSSSNTLMNDGDKWFSHNDILRLFTAHKVKEVLECYCHECRRQLSHLGITTNLNERDVERYKAIIVGNEGSQGIQIIFALLISIEYPKMIIAFLDRTFDNGTLSTWCNQGQQASLAALNRVWSPYRWNTPDDFWERVTERFLSSMYNFCPARFVSSKFYYEFGSRTVMPFYDQKVIGSGSTADVYEFKVHEEYVDRVHNSNKFARKEFHRAVGLPHFLQEVKNLGQVELLRDGNIVEVWKAYSKAGQHNIIFPLAHGGLDKVLFDTTAKYDSLFRSRHRRARIWKQMRGLARALCRIIYFDAITLVNNGLDSHEDYPVYRDVPDALRPEQRLLGYHFDIKLANILVYDDDDGEFVLKITDFGQARFQLDNMGRIAHPGGTDEYGPPESHRLGTQLNTRYDVWSLGCVFLELVVRTLYGLEGLIRFRNSRRMQENHLYNSRFYDTSNDGRSQSFTLRTCVDNVIRDALTQREEGDRDDNEFLSSLEEMLRGMLQPDVEQRWTIRKVFNVLDRLTRDQQTIRPAVVPVVDQRGFQREFEVGQQKLSEIAEIRARFWNTNAEFQPCVLRDTGTLARLRLHTSAPFSDTYNVARRECELIPYFAFRKSDDYNPLGRVDAVLAHQDGSFSTCEYAIDSLQEARKLQGFLTGHQIRASFELEQVTFNEVTSVLSWSRSAENLPVDTDTSSCTLQLWKEALPRHPREYAHPVPLRCTYRVVIFRTKEMIVLPFHEAARADASKHVVMKGHPLPQPDPVVRFYPTRRTRPYIDVSFLKSGLSDNHPGIPLDLNILHDRERHYKRKLKDLQIKFVSAKEAEDFCNIYLDLVGEWSKDLRPG